MNEEHRHKLRGAVDLYHQNLLTFVVAARALGNRIVVAAVIIAFGLIVGR